jgi:hypothetical protein
MAEVNERHGLRRAQCRGRAKVRIRAFGAAIAFNLKQLVRWHGRRPQKLALALRPEAQLAVPRRPVHLGRAHHICQGCQPFSHN